jgi:thioredoxin 1
LLPRLLIACLCAEWCGTCRDYRAVFDALRAALPAHDWRWVDVEDEAERVGDLDIETFPSLLIANDGEVLFGGPVLPRLHDSQRLVESLEADVREARKIEPRVAPAERAAYAALARALAQEPGAH